MEDNSTKDLILTLHSFRDNLLRDREEFQLALHAFLSAKRPPTRGHAESRQSYSVIPDVTTPKMMLDRRRNVYDHRLMTRGKQPMEEVPKYGLPGMGQYEETQKKYKEQLRDEYRNYMREQNASTTRRRLNDVQEGQGFNYDELLAKKREDERNYRNRNEGFANGGMRANSDGYLNRMQKSDYNYGTRPNVDVRPEVEQVTSMMNRIQRYNEEFALKDEEDVNYENGSYAAAPERPHSYPHDARLPPNYQQNEYSPEQDGYRRSESPRFITLDHPPVRPRNDDGETPNAYLNDLDNQVAASRRRRQKEKEEQMRYDRKLEEDNKAYDPWGRGGAGAPMRDRDGNVIASRKQMGGNVGERMSRGGHRIPPSTFTDANNRKKSDAQNTVHNYAIPRSPIPGQSSKYQGRKVNPDTYQEDLKRQIEEKKRRDKEEKERERLEEEKLMRRIQEENEKMQRDHEEEVQKQRLREDERRRRNEELQRRQEEQRKAAEMQKREKKLKRRQGQLEERGTTLARQSSKPDISGIKSPPLPGRKCKLVAAASNKPTIAALTAKGPAEHTHVQGSSKDHILSQLSAMRQQLEKEQQMMQQQFKREMGSGYEVYDKKTSETTYESNRALKGNRQPPSIYRQETPPIQPRPLVKKGVDGYETSGPGAINRKQNDWQQDGAKHKASDEYQYDVDQLAAHDAARRRYVSTLKDDPDEVKEDSFLDEFLAKNLQR